jgi:hypothetical protein
MLRTLNPLWLLSLEACRLSHLLAKVLRSILRISALSQNYAKSSKRRFLKALRPSLHKPNNSAGYPCGYETISQKRRPSGCGRFGHPFVRFWFTRKTLPSQQKLATIRRRNLRSYAKGKS